MNIAVSDGDKTSNGHTRVLKLTGSLSSEATLTITPDDREAFYIVHNTAGDAVRFKQISGNTGIVVPNGAKAFIYADGKGSGSANVFDLLDGFAFGGTKVASTATELNIVDGDTSATSTTVADADRVVLNDNGTMVQAAVTDISTYMNANAFLVPSAITSTSTLTPSAAKSIYQKVDTSSGNVTVTLAIGSLAIGQYIILDKTSSSNTMTVAYPSNSQGLSLGNSASFVIAINQDGSVFTFVETLKF